jgi:UDP-N-acetylglucosamine transferase subunit ALG13
MHEFERLMSQCTLLIMHGGAGSILNACLAGKRPVVMPRRARYGEIIDDHQVEFAEALARRGSVLLAHEPSELRSAIEQASRSPSRMLLGDEPALVDTIARLLATISGASK